MFDGHRLIVYFLIQIVCLQEIYILISIDQDGDSWSISFTT